MQPSLSHMHAHKTHPHYHWSSFCDGQFVKFLKRAVRRKHVDHVCPLRILSQSDDGSMQQQLCAGFFPMMQNNTFVKYFLLLIETIFIGCFVVHKSHCAVSISPSDRVCALLEIRQKNEKILMKCHKLHGGVKHLFRGMCHTAGIWTHDLSVPKNLATV